MFEMGIAEIRAHSAVVCDCHGFGVGRFGEGGRLIWVTGGAFFLVHEPVRNSDSRIGRQNLIR
jgi:hypothetical protein